MSDPNDYTVGWICAIPTEYVAAQAFLDERHDGPSVVGTNDNNDYTLGRIGKHNVVMAVLPDGEYGVSSATGVAKDLLHSFPNVRIGLMVGIAGGAPWGRKRDIRLGDVVVSIPRMGDSGVFQYDFGRTIQDQAFRKTMFLAPPPVLLRTAVNGLKSRYESDGHTIEESINDILKKKPRLRKKYRRPGPETDRLFQSDVLHPNEDETCDICCTDTSKLVQRHDREEEEEDILMIHYGLIASGNQLMMDASIRDKLSLEKDVLCFEMEAAGLMNQFPCLVIRGICDYSDTHKNYDWQGFSAMAAAALVEQNVKEIHLDLQTIVSEKERTLIKRWLKPPDPSTNFNKAIEQRQEGTGQWLLKGEKFEAWLTRKTPFLWLRGIPGCGKTVLSAIVIEHLKKFLPRGHLIFHFYFSFGDSSKQTLESLFRSLVWQIYDTTGCSGAQKLLDSMFADHNHGGSQSSNEMLHEAWNEMTKELKEDTWIVLDALDECSTRKGSSNKGLLSWIGSILKQDDNKIHLLVTSRPEGDISSAFETYGGVACIIFMQSQTLKNDIRAYIRRRVVEDEAMRRWRKFPEIQEEIEDALMLKADGMFRWVACQLDVLEDCLDYPLLKATLSSLPVTLDQTYSRIMDAIPFANREKAIKILQLLTYSRRPLTVTEVVDAIAVTTISPYFDPKNRMPEPREITRYCSSFITVVSVRMRDTWKDELHLAHLSVKEYLVSERLDTKVRQYFDETNAHTILASICTAYLLKFKYEPTMTEASLRQTYPWAQYAAESWIPHAKMSGENGEDLIRLLKENFLHQKSPHNLCYRLYNFDKPRYEVGNIVIEVADDMLSLSEPHKALFYAAFGGLHKMTEVLIKAGIDVNATMHSQHGNTALQGACYGGHEQAVRVLLRNGAYVNSMGLIWKNTLQIASANGYEEIVKLLLDAGANVNINARIPNYKTALNSAADKNYERIVRMLLSKGAEVNTFGGRWGTPLAAASYWGNELILKLLLEAGAEVNALGPDLRTALDIACEKDHKAIIELLVEIGGKNSDARLVKRSQRELWRSKPLKRRVLKHDRND